MKALLDLGIRFTVTFTLLISILLVLYPGFLLGIADAIDYFTGWS